MSVAIVASAATNFPQTATGRKRSQLLTDIATAAGGENDSDRLARALVALNRALRVYNEVLWKSNRVSTDITFVASDFDYSLPADFAAPSRAVLLDTNGKLGGLEPLCYVDYPIFLDFVGDETTKTDPPCYYSINNEHETGLVVFWPTPSTAVTTSTYPKVRLHYYRRIVLPTDDETKVNIPQELEGGVEDLAVAYYIGYVEGAGRDTQPIATALRHKMELEQRFRKWADR